jgi:ligand-binding SRPBCC domain-containing protein
MPIFEASVQIAAPVERVWAFHERDDVLERLAPPSGKPVVLSRTGRLETGAQVEFLVPIGPLRVRWIALHIAHEHNRYFIDTQIKGPFRTWLHQHRFEAVEGGGMLLTDHIEFTLPLHPLSDWVAAWAVRRQLEEMFRYRHKVTKAFCESGEQEA